MLMSIRYVSALQSVASPDLVQKFMGAQRKPNLILFLPDQQRADTLACYGGVKVRAPNLNKLASESVVFERTYVTHPVCTPSRSSLMTGTWPHTNGCTRFYRETSTRSFHSGGCIRGAAFALQRSAQRRESTR